LCRLKMKINAMQKQQMLSKRLLCCKLSLRKSVNILVKSNKKATMWKDPYDKLTNQLLVEKCNSDELADELEDLRNIAKGMQGYYERTSNAKTP